MIRIDKPVRHTDQLLFNLDASDRSNYGHVNRNPDVITIEKVQLRQGKSRHLGTVKPSLSVGNKKLELAIKLAKLDMSNSRIEEEFSRKKDQYLPKARSQKQDDVLEPVFIAQKDVYTKETVQSKPKKAFKSSVRKPSRHIQFRDSPTFEAHLQGIVKSSNRMPRRHEPQWEEQNIYKEVDSFANQSGLPRFAASLKTAVKKEKLRKQRMPKKPNKSGFLSLYRSPGKSRPLASTQRNQSISKLKHTDLSNIVHEPVTSSPIPISLKKYEFSPPVRLNKKRDFVSSRAPMPAPQTKDQSTSTEGQVKFRSRSKRSAKKSPENSVMSSLFGDIVQDTAERLHDMQMDLNLFESAHQLHNASTLENMRQRLDEIESEELEIRSRWNKIHYDDIDYSKQRHQVHFAPNIEKPLLFQPFVEDHEKASTREKPVYKFKSEKKSSFLDSSVSVNPLSSYRPKRTKLGLKESSIKNILLQKSERQKYLRQCFHEPKGRFNPWKIVEELSTDLLNEIMNSVCKEVDTMCDGFVGEVFEGEFAAPNHSTLHSLLEQSSSSNQSESISLGSYR